MRYKHIVFDIDGTLLDTEYAVLHALQRVTAELCSKNYSLSELSFALGIPGEVALQQLGITDTQWANRRWNEYMKEVAHTIALFSGIEELIKQLKLDGFRLGIITSKNRVEYTTDFLPLGIGDYFDTVICVEDSLQPKPSAEPMLSYLQKTGANAREVLYIGDTSYDRMCAAQAHVDFGLALWGCRTVKHIYADFYFKTPDEVRYELRKQTQDDPQMAWLKWAVELQFIGQAGITYCENTFDRERFERIREIAAEMVSHRVDLPMKQVKGLFCNETGFQTPKLDTRAAIFENDKILLVKEKNNTWSLPGGWVDVNQSIKSNTVKEVKEESGLDVIPLKIIALQDRNRHNLPLYAYGVCKAFVLCELIGGAFIPNSETVESSFFGLDELPLLAEEKNNKAQIRLCFKAHHSEHWDTIFD